MYNKFFGLAEAPFNITPDSRFLYLSRRHREALASLLYGIQQRKGFVLLTGEIGAGKTTVCRTLINDLHEHEVQLAVVFNSYLTEIELLKTINDEFGIDSSGDTKKPLIDALNHFLIEQNRLGRTCVLIIDEAQNLSPEVLEQVRMISNLETENEKLIQIVLMGQPELNGILELDRLEQLNQRITVRYHLKPLDENEIEKYLRHRLNCAQAQIELEFTPGALRTIYEYSAGVPRKINVLCDRALMVAYVASSYVIDEKMVRAALSEIRKPDRAAEEPAGPAARPRPKKSATRRILQPALIACSFVLVFCGIVYGVIAIQEKNLVPAFGETGRQPAAEVTAAEAIPAPAENAAAADTAQAQEPSAATAPELEESAPAKPRTIPVTAEMAWKFDAEGVLRVDSPAFARQAAQLTILSEWNIRPANLEQLRELNAETLARLDLFASNVNLGVAWFDAAEPLVKALIHDVPLLLTIGAEGQNTLAPCVALRKVRGEAVTIADPLWGEKIVRRAWLEKQVEAIQVVYIDDKRFSELLRGEESESVGELQEYLSAQGFYKRKITKIYDAATEQAIQRLQKFNELKETGTLDQPTAMRLVLKANPRRPKLFATED